MKLSFLNCLLKFWEFCFISVICIYTESKILSFFPVSFLVYFNNKPIIVIIIIIFFLLPFTKQKGRHERTKAGSQAGNSFK